MREPRPAERSGNVETPLRLGWRRVYKDARIVAAIAASLGAGAMFLIRGGMAVERERNYARQDSLNNMGAHMTFETGIAATNRAVDSLRAKTSLIDPFARYMLCWTTRQSEERSLAGCERSLIGTPLWQVLREEQGK